MKKLMMLMFCFLAFPAMALQLTWVAPTQREDGSALAATEIASYIVNATLNGAALPDVSVAGNLLTYAYPETVKGRYCFTMQTVDTAGLVSVESNQVCRNANPKPPSGVGVK